MLLQALYSYIHYICLYSIIALNTLIIALSIIINNIRWFNNCILICYYVIIRALFSGLFGVVRFIPLGCVQWLNGALMGSYSHYTTVKQEKTRREGKTALYYILYIMACVFIMRAHPVGIIQLFCETGCYVPLNFSVIFQERLVVGGGNGVLGVV